MEVCGVRFWCICTLCAGKNFSTYTPHAQVVQDYIEMGVLGKGSYGRQSAGHVPGA